MSFNITSFFLLPLSQAACMEAIPRGAGAGVNLRELASIDGKGAFVP